MTRPADPEPQPPPVEARRGGRPLIERLGMTAVAAVIGVLFGGVAIAAWSGGEPFLAVMSAIGALMTAWAALSALVRG